MWRNNDVKYGHINDYIIRSSVATFDAQSYNIDYSRIIIKLFLVIDLHQLKRGNFQSRADPRSSYPP